MTSVVAGGLSGYETPTERDYNGNDGKEYEFGNLTIYPPYPPECR